MRLNKKLNKEKFVYYNILLIVYVLHHLELIQRGIDKGARKIFGYIIMLGAFLLLLQVDDLLDPFLHITTDNLPNILLLIGVCYYSGRNLRKYKGNTKIIHMKTRRKVLCVGIDKYSSSHIDLTFAGNDAISVGESLKRNEDFTPNCDVKILSRTCNTSDLFKSLKECFNGDPGDELALFYFSGHCSLKSRAKGFLNSPATPCLITTDSTDYYPGIWIEDVINLANNSKTSHRLIILDCCHSGDAVDPTTWDNTLPQFFTPKLGTAILCACRPKESAIESTAQRHGIFTSALLCALNGTAADMCGQITASGVFDCLSSVFGTWEQRPLYAAALREEILLRTINSPISKEIIQKIPVYFQDENSKVYLMSSETLEMNQAHLNAEELAVSPESLNHIGQEDLHNLLKANLIQFNSNTDETCGFCNLTDIGVQFHRLYSPHTT